MSIAKFFSARRLALPVNSRNRGGTAPARPAVEALDARRMFTYVISLSG